MTENDLSHIPLGTESHPPEAEHVWLEIDDTETLHMLKRYVLRNLGMEIDPDELAELLIKNQVIVPEDDDDYLDWFDAARPKVTQLLRDENLATGGWVRPNSVEISGRHKNKFWVFAGRLITGEYLPAKPKEMPVLAPKPVAPPTKEEPVQPAISPEQQQVLDVLTTDGPTRRSMLIKDVGNEALQGLVRRGLVERVNYGTFPAFRLPGDERPFNRRHATKPNQADASTFNPDIAVKIIDFMCAKGAKLDSKYTARQLHDKLFSRTDITEQDVKSVLRLLHGASVLNYSESRFGKRSRRALQASLTDKGSKDKLTAQLNDGTLGAYLTGLVAQE